MAAVRLRRYTKRLSSGPEVGDVFHPAFAERSIATKSELRVWQAHNLYDRTPEWTSKLESCDTDLVRQSDLVVASSEAIGKALLKKEAKDVVVVPNGADVANFSAAADSDQPIPTDLLDILQPRIGYVGSLNRRIDFGLIVKFAEAEPTWQFIFIDALGSLYRTAEQAASCCMALPNVHSWVIGTVMTQRGIWRQ